MRSTNTKDDILNLTNKINTNLIKDYDELRALLDTIDDKNDANAAYRGWSIVHIHDAIHKLREHLKGLQRHVRENL